MNWQKSLVTIGLLAAVSAPAAAITPMPNPGGTPDYFATPNWANSPPLRKFVDTLPGLNFANKNNLNQYIPVAIPNTTTYPGSDYYEIELGEYSKQMHSDLPPTKLRGYRQTNTTDNNVSSFQYLGPLIIAQKNRPVRVKFKNSLTPGSTLFVPVDTTVMGAGEFNINYDPETKVPGPMTSGMFSHNRATLHLHGGRTPWISDGTPHQWITPAGEPTSYPKGVSVVNVPDMWFDQNGNTITSCAGQTICTTQGATNDPGPGSQTFYWTNQQSGRLMFYHDHAWGITRLNVYVGEAAGYLLQDPTEQSLINAGLIPSAQIPLIIQDKTFVDEATIINTDPTWNWGTVPGSAVKGDLWWPHVYMPAQNPYNPNMSGMNDFGRWHYGPWFFPPTPQCGSSAGAIKPFCIEYGPVANPLYDPTCDPATAPGGFCQPPEMPGTPNPSWGAEAFLDTPVVNGTAYPTITVQPQEYRLRILNAAHDRFLNLQLYQAVNKNGPSTPNAGTPVLTGAATDLTEVAMVVATPRLDCSATITSNCTCTAGFTPAGCYPATWPTDGREGGVPDPAYRGPAIIQIGTEGGFLPKPVLLNNQPVQWNLDPTMFNVGNVLQQKDGGGTLILAPAERADVIVDFSQFAGKTLILYNDAPTAFPALDPHYDYYTGAPDRQDIGGAPAVLPGYGPNVRTVMQIVVAGTPGVSTPDAYKPATLSGLTNAFISPTGAFSQSQSPVIVGQAAYNSNYNLNFPATWPNWGVSRISDNTLSFMSPDGTIVSKFPMKPKAIHDEMGASFDDYGRMSAKLGLEVPFVNAAIANFVLQNYVDPPTENVRAGQVQIWKITHNGVDTHPIHFHLFEVQLINRVGWDGFIRLPDPNELGWKDTIRVAPLEDTIVALRPVVPEVPFTLPESIRPLNPMAPLGSDMGFSQIDPLTGNNLPSLQINKLYNFGFEYVWHCHILSHEENDMMRPISVRTKDHIGVFRDGLWYLDSNDDGIFDASKDTLSSFGMSGDIPVTGDWSGSGTNNIGVFRQGTWFLDINGNGVWDPATDVTNSFGIYGDIPITGDWTGTGTTKIGSVRNTPAGLEWYLDTNGNGTWDVGIDKVYLFGISGDKPIIGDWTGNGISKIGSVRNTPTGLEWFLDINGNGIWDAGIDRIYLFGISSDSPVIGDWNGDGKAKIGVFRNGQLYMDINGNGVWEANIDIIKSFGITDDKLVTGKW